MGRFIFFDSHQWKCKVVSILNSSLGLFAFMYPIRELQIKGTSKALAYSATIAFYSI